MNDFEEKKENPADFCRVLLYPIRDRRQRERRNRRKNLWGNVSLLRGWQQHPRIDAVNYSISTREVIIHIWKK
ncbi:hypothetical protein [Cytobacillus gottheilii]|uniref:hypothetical protein n=1 Tax=Cytobacillus gottheilii TaxID=859144 RepID=UPI001C568F70|nr:hypothetical protein [Cytobacillus gottheilii]